MGLVLEKDGSSLEPPRDNYTEIGQILTIAKANEIGQIILIVNLVEIGLFEIVKVAEIAVAELEIAVLNVEVGLHVEEMTPHDQHWTNDDEGFTMDVARQHALGDDWDDAGHDEHSQRRQHRGPIGDSPSALAEGQNEKEKEVSNAADLR